MRIMNRKFVYRFILFSIVLVFFYQPSLVEGTSLVRTEKDTYNQGEKIKVNFFNSPGNDTDWICIVPASSPDTEVTDQYQYLPKQASQGVLTFDPLSPGKYEVRIYYNYKRNGYVVSDRYAFSVVSSPEGEALIAQRMERKIDPNNPLEANLPSEKGLVYIFREAFFFAYGFEIEIKANGTPVAYIGSNDLFPYSISAGDIQFSPGNIRKDTKDDSDQIRSWLTRENEVTIKVKPGHVYYLRLKMVPRPVGMGVFLDHIPHQEGANYVKSNRLTLLK